MDSIRVSARLYLLAILLLGLFAPILSIKANAQNVLLLDYAIGGNGYHGSSARISLGVMSQGVTFTLTYNVNGKDAYDLAGSVLTGIYDPGIHKFIAFGRGHDSQTRSWTSFTHFESYKIRCLYSGLSNTHIDRTTCSTLGYAKVYARGYALFKVEHSTWWGRRKSIHYDYIDLSVQAYVACSTLP